MCAFDHFANTYVTFNNACEAECWNAWISWEGDCSEVPVYGCTNPEALNYNPEATTDDGHVRSFLFAMRTKVKLSFNLSWAIP